MDFLRGRSPALDETVYENTNWAPRIGFAFDVTGDGKTVIKGHYGQYYEAILFDQYDRALPGWRDRITYLYDPKGSFCGPKGNCFSEDARMLFPRYEVDPDMKHPRVDEWTVGFERALTKDIRASVTGIWREDKNIQASLYPDARWRPGTVTNGLTGQPLTVYSWINQAASNPGITIQAALKKAGLTLDQIDLIEINEAFAAMPLVSDKILADDDPDKMKRLLDKTNVNGGTIAIGHPVGASGARILMTLIYELRRRGGGIGVASICGGLAQGDGAIVKVERE